MKKRLLAILLAVVMAAAIIPAFANTAFAVDVVDAFPDVSDPSKSYYRPVYWAVGEGLTVGYKNGNFGPADSCTRAQFVTFIWRLAGKPNPQSASSKFSDVNKSMSSFKPIMWAVENGIIVGYKDGTFRPSAEVTRRQVAVMLWRWQGKPAASANAPFTDVSVSDGAYKAVQWGAEAGVVKGSKVDGKSVFKPDDNCQRQQIVTFLYRFARDVQKKTIIVPPVRSLTNPTPTQEPSQPSQPASSDSDYVRKEVKLTMDNWQDYLEYIYWSGESGARYIYYYQFKLKDEYMKSYLEHAQCSFPDNLDWETVLKDSAVIDLLIATEEINVPVPGYIKADFKVNMKEGFPTRLIDEELLADGTTLWEGDLDKSVEIAPSNYARYVLRETKGIAGPRYVGGSIYSCYLTKQVDNILEENVSATLTSISGSVYVWEKK